jgi:ABC-type glutathione transport system ATPase component
MKKTVILVSHDSSALQMFCTKAVLIEKGEIKESGETTKVLKAYTEQNQEDQEKESLKRKPGNKISETGNGKASLLGMTLKNNISKKATVFGPNENIHINMRLKFTEYIKDPVIGLIIQDTEGGQPIFATNTLDGKMKTGSVSPGEIVNAVFIIENIFNDGKYYVSGAVASSDRSILFVRFMNAAEFQTIGWTVTAKARVYQDYKFKFIKEKNNENR